MSGAGHSAAIHSRDTGTILAYAAAVKALRVVVNAPCSQGAAGFGTHLAPAFTIGTGFFGSLLGRRECRAAAPDQLDADRLQRRSARGFGDFAGLDAWSGSPLPAMGREAPMSLGRLQEGARGAPDGLPAGEVRQATRSPSCARRSAAWCSKNCAARSATRKHGLTGMAELRSFIFIDQLQPQTLCYMASWMRGRLPRTNMAAQIIEVAPGLDIEALTDVALKHAEVSGGMLVVERQFGYLEFHSRSTAAVKSAARRCSPLVGPTDQATRPQILATRIVTRIDNGHAFLINRNKSGSMVLPGESLFVLEMQPASYAILATNEAEKHGRRSRSSTTA